jgi:hypothetical protein
LGGALMTMDFSYRSYEELIRLLKAKNYNFTDYKNFNTVAKPVIFRHDVDFDLEKVLRIAQIEAENGVKSTYFVLLTSDFYNVLSKQSGEILKTIQGFGHSIGLHFDETRYEIANKTQLQGCVMREQALLYEIIGAEVEAVSMHRPSKWILENDIQFENIINSYSKEFFSDFKYLSDSRMFWREDVLKAIKSDKYDKLHILTHPFWYDEQLGDIKGRVLTFINDAGKARYESLKDNIRDINEVVKADEIL